METHEIAELLRPYVQLEQDQLILTSTYINILLKWNARINLTAILDPVEIVKRHFGESYFAAKVLGDQRSLGCVIDLGSGAGFPGIPLAISQSEATVTLIESNGKKVAFLGEILGSLGLKNVSIFSGRGENFQNSVDLVVMRAVEEFEQAIDTAAGLVKKGGRLGLLIGEMQIDVAKARLPGAVWNDPVLIPESKSRVLLVGNL